MTARRDRFRIAPTWTHACRDELLRRHHHGESRVRHLLNSRFPWSTLRRASPGATRGLHRANEWASEGLSIRRWARPTASGGRRVLGAEAVMFRWPSRQGISPTDAQGGRYRRISTYTARRFLSVRPESADGHKTAGRSGGPGGAQTASGKLVGVIQPTRTAARDRGAGPARRCSRRAPGHGSVELFDERWSDADFHVTFTRTCSG